MFSLLTTRSLVHRDTKSLCVCNMSIAEKKRKKPYSKLTNKNHMFSPVPMLSLNNYRNSQMYDVKQKAIPQELIVLNEVVSDKSWTFVSHAVVNFSIIYFTLNWFYYFNLRRQIEKEAKDKHNKKK